jgi:putative transposase
MANSAGSTSKQKRPARHIYDEEGHAQFVTFSCYRRRRLLDHSKAKRIVLGTLSKQLHRLNGTCAGFVVMPDHVHAIVWFPLPKTLSEFLKQWKRTSSWEIKKLLRSQLTSLAQTIDLAEPVWQARYYSFNLFTDRKVLEKINYMHANPVRAGLVNRAIDWPWSSARYYELGKSVGVPIRPLD